MRTYTKGANTPRYWTESRFCCHAAETAILEIYFGSLRTSISSYFCPVNPLLIQPSHSISWFPSLTTVLWTTKPRYIKLCDFDVYAAGMCQLSRFSKLPHFTTPRVAMASDSSLCQNFIKSQDPSKWYTMYWVNCQKEVDVGCKQQKKKIRFRKALYNDSMNRILNHFGYMSESTKLQSLASVNDTSQKKESDSLV